MHKQQHAHPQHQGLPAPASALNAAGTLGGICAPLGMAFKVQLPAAAGAPAGGAAGVRCSAPPAAATAAAPLRTGG